MYVERLNNGVPDLEEDEVLGAGVVKHLAARLAAVAAAPEAHHLYIHLTTVSIRTCYI